VSTPDVPAPAGASFPVVARPVAPDLPRRPTWHAVALIVVGAACLIAMVPTFRHGVATHAFPSYVQGDPAYEVRRYSAPWVGGAVALGGVGLVCWAVAVGLLMRARRRPVAASRPAALRPAAALGNTVSTDSLDTGLAPRPTEAAREY
jgi:hypothetical protein